MDKGQKRFPWFHRGSWEEGVVIIQLKLVLWLNLDHGPSWCLETEVELVWEEREHELPKQRVEADSSSPGSLL